MKPNIAKYFWGMNEKALNDTQNILKNQYHPKFNERFITILSRCDKPKELFSIIPEQEFIDVWPRVKRHWARASKTSDFRNWWQAVYEGLLEKRKIKKVKTAGSPSFLFLKIGEMIKSARVKKGFSQFQLGVTTGVKQPDISKIEEGKKNITIGTLLRLCNALDINDIKLGKQKSQI